MGEVVSGYPFIPLVDNLTQDLLYSSIGRFHFALGFNHVASLEAQVILNQVGPGSNMGEENDTQFGPDLGLTRKFAQW